MEYRDKIVDKQVGRNSDLYAQSIAELNTREERYPHLRILVSIIEQAHPEWNQAPHKDRQVANLVFKMSKASIEVDEVAEIVRLRDAERGYGPITDDDDSRRGRRSGSNNDSGDSDKNPEKSEGDRKASGKRPARDSSEGAKTAEDESKEDAPAKEGRTGRAKARSKSASKSEEKAVEQGDMFDKAGADKDAESKKTEPATDEKSAEQGD